MNSDTIGIVIVNYMNYKDTLKMVNTFLELNYPRVEIVVVDNNSKNSSLEILKREFQEKNNIRIIKNSKNYGYGFGNNIGIEYLRKLGINFILISNPDILINDTNILKKLIKSFDRRDIAIVAPRISHLDNHETNPGIFQRPNERSIKLLKLKYLLPLFPQLYFIFLYLKRFAKFFLKRHLNYTSRKKAHMTKFLIQKKTEVYSVIGCFFMMNLNFFVDNVIYPVFDENIFMYNEELVLAEKIYKNKGKEIVLNNCKITHLVDGSFKLAFGKNYYLKILKYSFKSYRYILKNYF